MKAAIKLLTIITLGLIISLPQTAQAGSFRFGKDTTIVKIGDIKLTGPDGEALYLAHLIETNFFILGTHLTDKGYIIGIQGEHNKFYPMPEESKVKLAQQAGLLPEVFPEYKISPMKYAIGYSLWILLIVTGGWVSLKFLFKKDQTI
jgi:hypothetical protein